MNHDPLQFPPSLFTLPAIFRIFLLSFSTSDNHIIIPHPIPLSTSLFFFNFFYTPFIADNWWGSLIYVYAQVHFVTIPTPYSLSMHFCATFVIAARTPRSLYLISRVTCCTIESILPPHRST